MPIKRETYNYNLKVGRKVVYKGITTDLDKRAKEHAADGKKFTHIQKVGRVKTQSGASKSEAEQLAIYRKNNKGSNPKYNKTNHG